MTQGTSRLAVVTARAIFPPMTSDALGIEVIGLTKRYGERPALDGVSFSVPRGQICGYLGPNGAGKSTTMKALAGVIVPDGGTIRLAGHEVTGEAIGAKHVLGYVPESASLYSLLSAREHLSLVADLHGMSNAQAEERGQSLIAQFELEKVADRPVESLSKGQRQKALLATALLSDPEVLLLDEPLSGLDVTAARQLRDLLRELADAGRTILYCSHVLDVVERCCDRAMILANGRLVADGPTDELAARSKDKTLEGIFQELVQSQDVGLDGFQELAPR